MAGLTGLALAERADYVKAAGGIVQGWLAGDFWAGFRRSWDECVEKGEIPDDYVRTKQFKACLAELLDSLENDLPDEDRFAALQQIFLSAASGAGFNSRDVLPQQLMSVCRTLNSTDILILVAARRLADSEHFHDRNMWHSQLVPLHGWSKAIADNSVLRHDGLVFGRIGALVDRGLLRADIGRNGIHTDKHAGLTSLAVQICQFLQSGDPKPNV